jgi:hypothetical protein
VRLEPGLEHGALAEEIRGFGAARILKVFDHRGSVPSVEQPGSAYGGRLMVNLLEQIRAALDELEPTLAGRVVDVEMPRLFVEADDVDALRRALVAVIGRGTVQYGGTITARTVKANGRARLEVTGENRRLAPTSADWPDGVEDDLAAVHGEIGVDGPVGWLTVPLAGANAPE